MSLISLLLAHTATVSLALVLTAFIFLYFYSKSSKSSNYNFPPGPPALPVIGNLNILDLHRPYKTLSKLSETYGNVFTFHMGPKKYVVLTGYEAVKEALVTQADDFSERGQTHITEKFSKGGNEKRLRAEKQVGVHHHHHSQRLKRWPSVKTVGDLLLKASLEEAHLTQPTPRTQGLAYIRVTDGVICLVEPSAITDLHAVEDDDEDTLSAATEREDTETY